MPPSGEVVFARGDGDGLRVSITFGDRWDSWPEMQLQAWSGAANLRES